MDQKRPLWNSLIFRTLFLLIAVIAVLIALASYWFYSNQGEILRQSSYKKNFEDIERVSQSIGQEMTLFSGQLSLLSRTSAIVAQDSVISSSFIKSYDVASLFISGEYVALYDRNHELICNNSMVGSGQGHRELTEFDQLTPIRTYKTEWYWENDSPKKLFALEVSSRATANGALAASFSFRRIWQRYYNYNVGDKGFLIIIDSQNRVMMHPDLKLASDGRTTASSLGLPSYETLTNKPTAPMHIKIDDVTYLVASTVNSHYQFAIFSFQPKAEVESMLFATMSNMLLMLCIIVPITILIIVRIFNSFARPLRKLVSHIEYISKENFDAELFPDSNRKDEIGSLTNSFNKMQALIQKQIKQLNEHQAYLEEQVKKRTAELEEAKDRLDRMSRTDELTGLPNRRDMREKINDEINRSTRLNREFCLLFADIDKFKHVNDTYGHNCGDLVLKTVSSTIRQLLRKYDFIARWGGEEFLTILPETDLKGAQVVAERFRKKVESLKIIYGGQRIPVTITLGVALYDHRLGMDRSIQLADQALYYGKEHGRNQVVTWDPSQTTEEDYRAAELERQMESMDAAKKPELQVEAPQAIENSKEAKNESQKNQEDIEEQKMLAEAEKIATSEPKNLAED